MSMIRSLFNGGNVSNAEVVRRLHAAQSGDVRLELQALGLGSEYKSMIVVMIEQVREDDIIVHQPPSEDARQMIRGSRFTLGFYEPQGRVVGETKCLGRAKIMGEHNRIMYGLKLSIPPSLSSDDSKVKQSKQLAIENPLEVELSSFEHHSPIYGLAMNIGRRSMKIRCQNAMNKLHAGQEVYLKMQLSLPGKQITEMVRVTDLLPDQQGHDVMVTVSFHKEIAGFDDLLDQGAFSSTSRMAG